MAKGDEERGGREGGGTGPARLWPAHSDRASKAVAGTLVARAQRIVPYSLWRGVLAVVPVSGKALFLTSPP